MGLLGFPVSGRVVRITQEQARWLVAELRALRPVDVTGAAAGAAGRIESALADGSPEVAVEQGGDGIRAVLMALEDVVEAPEPLSHFQELHDALVAELVARPG